MRRLSLIAGLLMLVLVGATRADVRDHAELFKPETLTEANQIIRDIEKTYHRNVVFETLADVPDSTRTALQKAGKNASEREKVYVQLLRQRAKAEGISGLFILVVASKPGQPGHIEIEPGTETRKKDFTLADAEDLQKQLREAFHKKEYDDGLIEGLKRVRSDMEAHQGHRDPVPVAQPDKVSHLPPKESDEGWSIMGSVCLIAGIVLVFWVIISLIRAFTGGGRSMAGGGGGQMMGGPGYVGGGGGGFMSNFMGGMFGAVAGNWMYNNFFGGGHHGSGMNWDNPAHGGEPDYRGGEAAPDRFDDQATGGDFGGDDAGGGGDLSGGGDWGGGGDAGGGDFGGGDFGGGGGDFGGGGDY